MRARYFLAVLLVGALSCSKRLPPPRHLLLVTVDTLRADALGFEQLAQQSFCFDQALAPRAMTFPSLSTIFTGLSPIEHGALSNGDMLPQEHETLAEKLTRHGFYTAAFTTNKLLVPGSGIEQGFASFQSDFSPARDETMADAAMRCLTEHAAKGERVFVWLHLVGPHLPYAPEPLDGVDFRALHVDPAYRGPADGSRAYADDVHAGKAPLEAADLKQMRALYAAEVARVDHVLWRSLSSIDLDSCLFVFTADHGEELGERNRYFGHSKSVTSAGLHVPLYVRYPAFLPPAHKREPFGLHELSGFLLFWMFPGEESLKYQETPQVGLWRDRIFSARDARWRLVWNPDKLEPQETPPGPYPVPEIALYDELADPRDERDLSAQHPEEVARLKSEIERWRARQKPWSGVQVAPSPERTRALREMGYAGEKDSKPR